VALGQAKRKIQQIVDAGRQRKRQSTRARIARWDTAGKPTRQAAIDPEPGSKTPVVIPPSPAAVTPALLSGDEEQWEIGYAPLRHEQAQLAEEEQVQDE
jgi:hypothetical protein